MALLSEVPPTEQEEAAIAYATSWQSPYPDRFVEAGTYPHTRLITGGADGILFFKKILESWADVFNATSLEAGGTGAFSS